MRLGRWKVVLRMKRTDYENWTFEELREEMVKMGILEPRREL